MVEAQGNVWDFYGQPDTVIVIPTNGDVNRNGECVMGRGLALQAKKRIPGIALELGKEIKQQGNVPVFLDHADCLSFPVKHHWFEKADLDLIQQSACILESLAHDYWEAVFVGVRFGCGNGKLNWKDVKPILESLPDNVLILNP